MSESSEPDIPDWLWKAFALVALFVLLMAVLAAAGVLLPRILGT